MRQAAAEICREIVGLVEPSQCFLLDEHFAEYAKGYPKPAVVSEGHFESGTASLLVAILVPFVIDIFKEGVKDALKDKVKESLERVFRRKQDTREADILELRNNVEKVIGQTQLSVRDRERCAARSMQRSTPLPRAQRVDQSRMRSPASALAQFGASDAPALVAVSILLLVQAAFLGTVFHNFLIDPQGNELSGPAPYIIAVSATLLILLAAIWH